jgi:WD40 repeat protein
MLLRSLHGHDAKVTGVAFNHDGTLLGTTSADGFAKIWDLETRAEQYALESPTKVEASTPSFSPDGSLFAAAWPSENVVRIMNLATGRIMREIYSVAHPISTSFHPSGDRIAIVSDREPAVVVDVRSGNEVFTLEGPRSGLRDVVWSPDGASIATLSQDGSGGIFHAATGRQHFAFPGAPRIILPGEAWPPARPPPGVIRVSDPDTPAADTAGRQLSFSADGSRLATATDLDLRIWDPHSGEQQLVLRIPFSSVALSPDGSSVASARAHGELLVAPLDLDDVIEVAKRKLNRSPTDEECRRYRDIEGCPRH